MQTKLRMALTGINYCLDLIGFDNNNERLRIRNDRPDNFADFRIITSDDINKMAKAFGK